MITSSILLIFFGSFFFYNTSKKALLEQNFTIEKWVQANTKPSKIIGISLYLIALIMEVKVLGFASGIFFWLVAVMTVLSLYVVLFPMKKINYKHLLVFFSFSLFIEIFI